MSNGDFLLWTSDYQEGFCVIDPPVGVEDAYQLSEGVSRLTGWPSDVLCRMSDEFPKDVALADNLYEASGLAIVSEKLREEIEAAQSGDIEFLPVSVVNHKGRREPSPFFIMNPLAVIDCIDIDASEVEWNLIEPGLIDGCEQLVLRPGAVPDGVSVFRPKHLARVILVRSELADRLRAAGFSGLVFGEPLEYTGLG